MSPKLHSVLQMLVAADGACVTSQAIEQRLRIKPRTGGARVAALRQARPDLPIENVPGFGYRLPAGTPVDQPAAPPEAPRRSPRQSMADLSPRHLKLLGMLTDAAGEYVAGQDLAAAIDVGMPVLTNWIRALRRAVPELAIEGTHGRGYRAIPVGGAAPAPMPATQGATIIDEAATIAAKNRWLSSDGQRLAANRDLLDMLPARSAELVKTIAIDSGETIDATFHRLLSYGCEVHIDLIAGGENPIGLRRPRQTAAGETIQ